MLYDVLFDKSTKSSSSGTLAKYVLMRSTLRQWLSVFKSMYCAIEASAEHSSPIVVACVEYIS